MEKIFLMVCICLTSILGSSQTITFLDKDEVYKSKQNNTVVMDKYTFGKYHYTAAKYDTLKKEVERYDSIVQNKDSAAQKVVESYKETVIVKDKQIKEYSEAYTSMKNGLTDEIAQKRQLQIDYKKLEQKHRRIKTWRNFFIGTSAVLGSIIVIAVTH